MRSRWDDPCRVDGGGSGGSLVDDCDGGGGGGGGCGGFPLAVVVLRLVVVVAAAVPFFRGVGPVVALSLVAAAAVVDCRRWTRLSQNKDL